MYRAPVRAFIVDDDPDTRSLISRALQGEFATLEAREIADLGRLDNELVASPNLVITDYDLRGSTGFEVFAMVRQRCPLCSVIMHTGTGNEELAVRAMKAGMDDYVVKAPGQFKRLAVAARAAVERAEEKRRLEENRELLLQELYHRIHNNLQIVISLMGMTARAVTDVEAKEQIEDLARRIQSLGLLQEKLYRSDDFRRVDFHGFLQSLLTDLIGLGGGRIALATDLTDTILPVDTAVPLALIANELVTNALKHAFPDGRAGKLTVRLASANGAVVLEIADDGIGRSSTAGSGLGTTLIRRLVQQIGAALTYGSTEPGTKCRVTVTP